MQRIILATSASILLATAGFAQSGPADSTNPALKDSAPRSVPSPAKGESSFTEKQAQDRIMKAGYTDVSALTKQDSGWHGTAMKDGKQVSVTLDYKGNITTR